MGHLINFNKLSLQLLKQDNHMRKSVSVNRRVAITVWCISMNAEYRTFAHLFAVAKSPTVNVEILGYVIFSVNGKKIPFSKKNFSVLFMLSTSIRCLFITMYTLPLQVHQYVHVLLVY